MSKLIGTVLDRRYKIVSVLGEGGIGTTFAGTDLKGGAEVVVKVLGRGLRTDAAARDRFRSAVAMQGELSEAPHSPDLLTAVTDGAHGPLYVVRSWVAGFTLREAADPSAPIPLDVILEILSGLLGYLEELERRKLRHGGLSPRNVVLTDQGGIAVLDPGLALWVIAPGAPLPDALEPSRRYVAPGFLVAPYDEDIRGDLFAVAQMVDELLSILVDRGAREVAVRAEKIRAEVILPGLRSSAADRYGTVAEFRAALAGDPRPASGPEPGEEPTTGAVPSPPAAADLEATEVTELAERCGGMGLYELFDLDSSASSDRVRARYYELLARYHPARSGIPPLEGLSEPLAKISNRLSEAFATLNDPIARAAYDERRAYARADVAPDGAAGSVAGSHSTAASGLSEHESAPDLDLGDEEQPPADRGFFGRLFGRRGAKPGS